jgi:pyridoxal phosphate enzyme (YggS family)
MSAFPQAAGRLSYQGTPTREQGTANVTPLADRLAAVEERIRAACRRAGRLRDEVTLVAVTKAVSPAVAAQIAELGVRNLGENRPQELWRKAAAVPGVRWHLIGHLQRNKIEKTLPLVYRIHSVDSLRLLEALEQEAARRGQPVEVLLECNASGEASKHGFALEEVPGFVPQLAKCRHVHITGLMTMAAFEPQPEKCRPTFAALRQLCDRLRPELPPPHRLEHLSMGMSNDFEVAIEEGATLIRLGTVLFEDTREEAT